MIIGDGSQTVDSKRGREKVSKLEKAEELEGKLDSQKDHNKLMHSVLEGDKDAIDEGKLLSESINQNLSSFVPDMMFKNMVNDYKLAKKLYGEYMIRKLAGYDPNFIEKNLKIPEFKDEIRKNIEENVKTLKQKELINKEGEITNKGLNLSAIALYAEELDKLKLKGLGEKKDRKKDPYGEKTGHSAFRKTRYRDIAMRESVKNAIRRGHSELQLTDLRVYDKIKKGGITIIYALDTSGSMKGEKIRMGKQAGVALAYKAMSEKNKVGLIVFNDEVKNSVEPCLDFPRLVMSLTNLRTKAETDYAKTIDKAIELFHHEKGTKHLVLLTDALPTKGDSPQEDTLRAVGIARESGITISIIGIGLDKDGEKLSKKIIEISQGRLYKVKNVNELDQVILEDYYSLR